jgi:endonuclease/exonuclease/phosphatase family metal-dependent hydrolase
MIPTIFAGDFNITPSSDEYNFFAGDQDLPESKTVYLPKEDQEDISYQSFKMTTTAQTTPFTCHSETKFGGYFKDTLDYIFVSNANIKLSGALLETNEKKLLSLMFERVFAKEMSSMAFSNCSFPLGSASIA